MRITNNMMSNQFLTGYQSSLSRMNDIQAKISTSKEINKPSDNPVGAARSLNYSVAKNTNSLFSQNATDAISWMTASDSAMQSIITSMTSIKTSVTSAIAASTSSSYDAIEQSVDGAIKEIVSLGNTQVGDRYIFGGQKDNTAPFTLNAAGTAVTYNGTYDGETSANSGTITMQVSPGATTSAKDKINVDGQDLFGPIDASGSPKILTDLLAIKQHLIDVKTGAGIPPVTTDTLTNDLGTLTTDMDSVITAQTAVGARQSAYTTIQSRLTADSLTIESDRSANEDLDVAKATIDLQTAENVYNSLLSVGAKVLPKSLVDYL
jgi:flagellar hook-associated protein 3 FlgL